MCGSTTAGVRTLVCRHGLLQETASGSTRQSLGSDVAVVSDR